MDGNTYDRARLYAALAQAYRRPRTASDGDAESLAGDLQQAAAALDPQTLAPLADAVAASLKMETLEVEDALLDLELEYNRLFYGPGRPAVSPYESAHCGLRRQLMGEVARDVNRAYAEAGVTADPDRREPPDHVATELGFMAYLATRQMASRDHGASAWREHQSLFLRKHLGVWVPDFCRQVEEASHHPFYTALAGLTSAFIDLEFGELTDERS